MTYDLPLPISVNALFANKEGVGRVKTRDYKKWVHQAGLSLMVQRSRPVGCPVNIEILVSEKSRCDLDNCAKCVCDVLVYRGVIQDDNKRFLRAITLRWSSEVEGMRVIITSAKAEREAA